MKIRIVIFSLLFLSCNNLKEETSIEKYNKCVIIDDVIYAFPYGQSADFQKLLIFDTLTEKAETIDLRYV